MHWAHRVTDWFPGGQLYANLRGFDPSGSPRAPEEVLRGFLDALQVPSQQVPTGFEAQCGLYRSLLSSRRMLVLLDNARDAEQVRPLLPGSPGSHVIVTSRDGLTGLIAAEGARPVMLDVLSAEEAWQLLERRLGPQRVTSDPLATTEVIGRCAGLPLALAVVAAHTAQRPDAPMSDLAAELGRTRADLDAFAHSDQMTDVRAVFSWSYRTLSAAAARLFRLLSVHNGPDTSALAAVAIAGMPLAQLRPLLAELTAAHLLTEPVADRYVFHDLLRTYSFELAQQIDAEAERQEALHRMLDHYVHTSHSAAIALDPYRAEIPLDPPRDNVTPEVIADYRQAVKWFTVERQVLVAAVHQAVATGTHGHAWRIAWACSGFLDVAGDWAERAALLRATLDIAPQDPEWPWQAFVHRSLGHAYVRVGRFDDAHHHLQQALILFRDSGDQVGEARTHLNIGIVLDRQGRPDEGIAHGRAALELYRAADHLAGQADALNSLGWDHAQRGDFQQALTYCQQSLELHLKLDHRHGQADVWDSLGYIHRHLAHFDEAVASYGQAIRIFHDLGDRFDEAGTFVNLGDTHLAAGNRQGAQKAWLQALAIFTDLRHPDAANVQARLKDAHAARR